MSWKIYITAFVSSLFIAFPQNLIGCGDTEDPYDYFTSFFSKGNADSEKIYEPFYYTSLLDFYDDWMNEKPPSYEKDKVIEEWKNYCNASIKTDDAVSFIYTSYKETIDSMLLMQTSNNRQSFPSSLSGNSMAKCMSEDKNREALRYLSFAKKIEVFCSSGDWESLIRPDSNKLNQYILEADKAFQSASTPFLKNKYAFQKCKIAFYNNRFGDCIQWYNEYFKSDNTSAVHALALSYKAGSLFRLGKNAEAAYDFSRAFVLLNNNKKKVFLGFLWATDKCNPDLQESVLAFARTDKERANILALFSLHGESYRLPNLEQVYKMDPVSPLLSVLTIREINKLEEQYLTPILAKEAGGKPYYFLWEEDLKNINIEKLSLHNAGLIFEKIYRDNTVSDRGLYIIAAAYIAFVSQDFTKAKSLLSDAKNTNLNDRLKDQLQLIELLVAANENARLDTNAEQSILASVKWLIEKGKNDEGYKLFLRNFFSQIIAQKYEQQGDQDKAALAYGVADLMFVDTGKAVDEVYFSTTYGIDYIRNEMDTQQALKLYALLNAKILSPYDQLLIANSSFDRAQVIDVIGTSYLRDFNFEKAVEWLKKTKEPQKLIATKYDYTKNKEWTINVDPFYDYLNDWQRYDKTLSKPLTKLSFAQSIVDMQHKADTAKSAESRSRIYYQLASAFYNMSYYGNSWNAVAYSRSGTDWNDGNYKLPWQKEYYGVFKAKEYYQKSLDATKNKELKAAAYFMIAKCLQRQLPMPQYGNEDYDKYEAKMIVFEKKFKTNPMFDGFVKQYSNTKFYKYSFSRCSYLRDFVKSNSSLKQIKK